MTTTMTRLWRRSWILTAVLLPLLFATVADTQPPGFPGGPGGFPGGFPRPPIGPGGVGRPHIHSFYCSNCGRKVGEGLRSEDKERFASCPFCGVQFDTAAGRAADGSDDGRGNWNRNGPNQPGPPGGYAPPPRAEESAPPNDNQGAFQPPATPNNPTTPAATPTPSVSQQPSSPPAKASRAASILIVVLVVGLVLLLGFVALVGGVVWMISTAPGRAAPRVVKVKRKRQAHDYEPI